MKLIDPIFQKDIDFLIFLKEHKLESTSINEDESCGDEMNESIDDGISSHISSIISSRSHSEFGNSSQPGSSIGSAGSLVLRNRISIRNARTNTKLVCITLICFYLDLNFILHYCS